MEEKPLEMPFLRNVGFVVTYKCQVSCSHCILEAGPHRTEEMALEDSLDWIRQVSGYRNGYIKVLSLTGGEPFYDVEKLRMISAFASKRGVIVSAVTNAYWADTRENAVSMLESMPEIKMLAISTDVYHLEYIPFERVVNAIQAAEQLDMPYNVHVCTDNEDDEGYREIMVKLEEITDHDYINTAITFPAGRALRKISDLKYHTTEAPPISACSAGSSPIVFPDGRVIACIGPVIDLSNNHPLYLGSLRERSLEEILDDAEVNPILHAVRVWGPRRLISLIEESEYSGELPSKYVKDSVCDACYQLMSNPDIVGFLEQLAEEPEFKRKVAYARAYYMKETRMVELIRNLNRVE